jgi:hypothetical protein
MPLDSAEIRSVSIRSSVPKSSVNDTKSLSPLAWSLYLAPGLISGGTRQVNPPFLE